MTLSGLATITDPAALLKERSAAAAAAACSAAVVVEANRPMVVEIQVRGVPLGQLCVDLDGELFPLD